MPVPLAPPTHLSLFQTYSSAQRFHRVSADSNVGDLLPVACRAHKAFTGSSGFDALVDETLLISFCCAILHHPTNGTSISRSRSRIASSITNTDGAHFQP